LVKLLYRQKHGYNVAVYPNDHEPAHVHVTKDKRHVIVFLAPIEFGQNDGFKNADLRRIRKLVKKHKKRLFEAWIEYHGISDSEGY